jgi:glycosyltransferase involved in cell wall biosynthesis
VIPVRDRPFRIFMPASKRPSRIPLYWLRILEALNELDIPVEVIGAEVRTLAKRRQFSSRGRAVLPSAASVCVLLRSSAPVFLCVEHGVTTLLAAAAARLQDKQTIIFQEHRRRDEPRFSEWERRYRQLLGRFVHAFIANTDGAYGELADVIGVDRRKIFRGTLLVPPERASLSVDAGAPPPEPTRRPLFLFVGRLLESKNVGGLLKAAVALRARGFEFEIWIVGTGPERQALQTMAGTLISEGFVRFLGAYPNTAVGPFYETADVFVMPSFSEYRSMAVLEALRFGTPVIDSLRDGNAGDSVRHELTGLVFDPGVWGALEGAMERAITETETWRKMGQRGAAMLEAQTPRMAAAALRDVLSAVQAGVAPRGY